MPQIPTPDEQLEAFKDTPGVTPNEVAQAEHWARTENVRRRNFGLDWARKTEVRNNEVWKAVAGDLRDLMRRADDLIVQAEGGDYDTVDDLFREVAELRRAHTHHERTINALATTEQTLADVKEDAAAYYHAFFERFPALIDRVPTLADAIARYRTPSR